MKRTTGVHLRREAEDSHVTSRFSLLSTRLCNLRLCNLTCNLTMPFDKHLHNLLEQPFGPYLEEAILSDRCKYFASKNLLLEDFQLAYNNKPTG